MNTNPSAPSVAVLIPCYQEEKTIGKVVADFRRALPKATIYVYDNNCTDATAAETSNRHEYHKTYGNDSCHR